MSRRGLWTIVCLAGCAPQPGLDAESSPLGVDGVSPWAPQVGGGSDGAGLQWDGHALVTGPEHLTGRFSVGEVVLAGVDEALALGPARVGRDGVGEAPVVAPQVGACVDAAADPASACVRRLEYVGATTTEWWVGRRDGLQQGWVVTTPPTGASGDLTFDVSVDDAVVSVDVDASRVSLALPGGGTVSVDRLGAVDADGVVLPAWFEPADGGFRVRVDDASATYPVYVDPVYTAAAWSVSGQLTAPVFPTAVAHADVDADGYDDLVVGASDDNASAMFVYRGSPQGVRTIPDQVIVGPTGIAFATALAHAGDVNDDGFGDIIVGAPGSGTQSGSAYVYLGSATGLGSPITLTGGSTASKFGYAVAGLGDVNGDGRDDVAVGAPQANASIGAYTVHLGTAAGVSSAPSFAGAGVANANGNAAAGLSVAGPGDINGDGYADLLVGGPTLNKRGVVYIHLGSAAGITSTRSSLSGPTDNCQFGWSVAGAGDITGDGRPDFLVGAPKPSENGFARLYRWNTSSAVTVSTFNGAEFEQTGLAVAGLGDVSGDGIPDVAWSTPLTSQPNIEVRYGTGTGLPSAASLTLIKPAIVTSGSWGELLRGVGDLNGDGRPDMVIGAAGAFGGLPFVYYGGTSGLDLASQYAVEAPTAETTGATVASGDVDGDGHRDVVYGGPGGGNGAGLVRWVRGTATGPSTGTPWTMPGLKRTEALGSSLAVADLDDDGFDDIIAGAPGAPGRVDVFYGTASGPPRAPSVSLSGTASTSFGAAVTARHDLTGDGIVDLVVAATFDGRGRVSLFPGSASGVATTPSWTAAAGPSASRFGTSLATADIDGDGDFDLLVGDPRPSARGWVGVFRNTAAGLPTAPDQELIGESLASTYGRTLAFLGDVDGDGSDDVAVGSPGYASSRGRVYVLRGSASGLVATPYATFTGETTSTQLGIALAGAGDVNADGRPDLITSGSTYASSSGRVWVYTALPYGFDATAVTVLPGAAGSFGAAVGAAGDVDGDGYDDVVVGATRASSSGTVYVFRGYRTDADGDGYDDSVDCNDASSAIRPGAVELCDAASVDEDCDGLRNDADPSVDTSSLATWFIDADGDTFGAATTTQLACSQPVGFSGTSTDCNDGSALINPAATEVCDASNVDEDCDGAADDLDPSVATNTRVTFHADVDTDGYGAIAGVDKCDAPVGYVVDGTDCDDAVQAVNPGATEVCDGGDVDEDCDGDADDEDASVSAASRTTFWRDIDGDSWGGATTLQRCDATIGVAARTGDCDDIVAAVNPGGTEVCDAGNADEDCDGSADDLDAGVDDATRSVFYADVDGDGYGTLTTTRACDLPSGYAALSGDCADGVMSVNPGAAEVCDASDVDEDCDSLADDLDASVSVATQTSWWSDADGDTYGAGSPVSACDAPSGRVGRAGDCNDGSAAISPAATEVCDVGNVDEDCDTLADDADASLSLASRLTFYVDGDGDGAGGTTPTLACDVGPGRAADDDDCNDSVASIRPGGQEVCDAANVDEDCDGTADDADVSVADAGRSPFYLDGDGDTWGSGAALRACDTPVGRVPRAGDCNDAITAVNPGAVEVCDGANTDEDCDLAADDADPSVSPVSLLSFYVDVDLDGYGGATSVLACDVAPGRSSRDDDCDDGDADVSPAAIEVCDALDVDEDCDGRADDADASLSLASARTLYVDDDLDGFGGSTEVRACDPSAGVVETSDDCDDGDAGVNPDATEVCDGGDVDEDCDTLADDDDATTSPASFIAFFLDADEDGYGAGTPTLGCEAPANAVAQGADCDDADDGVNPGAQEVCDAADVDEDCDGDADNDDGSALTSTQVAFHLDVDNDGFGARATSGTRCDALAGEVTDDSDCDDTSTAVRPGAVEAVGDEVDQDCDGVELCHVDDDGDGARTAAVVESPDATCRALGEAVVGASLDCDDDDARAFPGATELVGTGVDEDCDGGEICYVDGDDDGYLVSKVRTVVSADADCGDVGEGRADDGIGDCLDSDPRYNPGADESDCTDPNDYNCDASIGYDDADGDGYAACEDCNDDSTAIRPGATEVAGDGIDQDCDAVDLCFVDADDDGWRPNATATVLGTTLSCTGPGEAPAGAPTTDCDDAAATTFPGATEVPGDLVDQDCNGRELCFVDRDGDGFRPDATSTVASTDMDCRDAGEAVDSKPTGDCNDNDIAVRPTAVEGIGDGVDANCDGRELCWPDDDRDGFRPDEAEAIISLDRDCSDFGEALTSTRAGDCDDGDAAYNPSAAEADCADPNDYNCDGSVAYDDLDGDGFAACEECNDADELVNPDATELPGDLVDQDCDTRELCFVDADDDGYRPSSGATREGDLACAGSGLALASAATTDCNDAVAAVRPGVTETPADGVDQNCDGLERCYVDADDDGYRSDEPSFVDASELDCSGDGQATAAAPLGDCDDEDADYRPGAPEPGCTPGLDFNCDDYTGGEDADLDDWGACDDCDDGNPQVFPDATERCNGIDDDCDEAIDEAGATGETTWYADADGDTWTTSTSTLACAAPDGFAAQSASADCDDSDASVNPAATEVADDGIDQDCVDGDLVDGSGGTDDGPSDGGEDTDGDGSDDGGCDGCANGGTSGLGAVLAALLAVRVRRRRVA